MRLASAGPPSLPGRRGNFPRRDPHYASGCHRELARSGSEDNDALLARASPHWRGSSTRDHPQPSTRRNPKTTRDNSLSLPELRPISAATKCSNSSVDESLVTRPSTFRSKLCLASNFGDATNRGTTVTAARQVGSLPLRKLENVQIGRAIAARIPQNFCGRAAMTNNIQNSNKEVVQRTARLRSRLGREDRRDAA